MLRIEHPEVATTLVFLVNGTPAGAMGIRAREFAQRLARDFQVHVAYRSVGKVRSIWTFLRLLLHIRPDVCYVLDMGYSGVFAAGLYRAISRGKIVVDTGDAIYDLARSMGRGPLGLALTKLLEFVALHISHRMVVRSHFHQQWLTLQGFIADVIPDGVDTMQFRPMEVTDLRRKHNLEGFTTIGVLGSVIWNKGSKSCYGWDLVELIAILRAERVKGVIVGDGSGIRHLKSRCRELGIEDRILFLGYVPYQDLPEILNLMDICLSTQTNDLAGRVRTTGKLPLYLACGRFVLASDVGEAALCLPPMMLIPPEGTNCVSYPEKLAVRVTELLSASSSISNWAGSTRIAVENFEYSVLAGRLRCMLAMLYQNATERPSAPSI